MDQTGLGVSVRSLGHPENLIVVRAAITRSIRALGTWWRGRCMATWTTAGTGTRRAGARVAAEHPTALAVTAGDELAGGTGHRSLPATLET